MSDTGQSINASVSTVVDRIVCIHTYALYDIKRGAIRGTYDCRADAVAKRGSNERVVKLSGSLVLPKKAMRP